VCPPATRYIVDAALNIDNPTTYREIVGLRISTVAALTMGSAPNPVP